MNVWFFTGADGLRALTPESDGFKLPGELGPSTKVRSVELDDDAPDEQEGIALMDKYGFCCFD